MSVMKGCQDHQVDVGQQLPSWMAALPRRVILKAVRGRGPFVVFLPWDGRLGTAVAILRTGFAGSRLAMTARLGPDPAYVDAGPFGSSPALWPFCLRRLCPSARKEASRLLKERSEPPAPSGRRNEQHQDQDGPKQKRKHGDRRGSTN